MLARTSLVVKDFFDRAFLTCVATRWAKIQNRLHLEFASVIALRRIKHVKKILGPSLQELLAAAVIP
jgi:hypothetical protein